MSQAEAQEKEYLEEVKIKLKDSLELSGFELLELGVIGFDLVSYVDDGDKLIIIDAIKSDENIGKVEILEESDMIPNFKVVSQHDFGVEQTFAILRHYKPGLESFNVVGVNVKDIDAFSDVLSEEILGKIQEIKKDVVSKILNIAEDK